MSDLFEKYFLFLQHRLTTKRQKIKEIQLKMRKTTFCLTTLCLLVVLALSSCGRASKAEQQLNRLLRDVAENDHTIDSQDWSKIRTLIESQSDEFNQFYNDGQLDKSLVKTYITEFFKDRRPSFDVAFVGIDASDNLAVDFYLERSGSMVPYDSPDGDGAFKQAVIQLLNALPKANQDYKIYVVNNAVTPYPDGFDKFLSDNDIFGATKGYGDPSYTDFKAIFQKILSNASSHRLSVLVTDMIYSTKDMNGINPEKVFAEAQGMTTAVFKDAAQQKSMLIVKLHASYHGPYYCYDQPSTAKAYHGQRPYYVVVVGDNADIARLTQDNTFQAFASMKNLRGYENMHLFCASTPYHPHFSFLLNHADIRGRFKADRGQTSQISQLNSLQADPTTGKVTLALAVDLSHMLLDESYVTNISHYDVQSETGVKIVAIRPLNVNTLSKPEKKYAGSATHVFLIETERTTKRDDVTIALRNELPTWVEQSSSNDDRNLSSPTFANTTFGLKYLLQGIYDSYKKSADGNPYFFKLQLTLSD